MWRCCCWCWASLTSTLKWWSSAAEQHIHTAWWSHNSTAYTQSSLRFLSSVPFIFVDSLDFPLSMTMCVSILVCQLSKWRFGPKMKPSERGEASASAHFVIWLAIHIPSCTSDALFRGISSALKRYLGEQAGCFSILSSIQSVSTAHALWLTRQWCLLTSRHHSFCLHSSFSPVSHRSMKV